LSEKGVAHIALPADVATENVERDITGHPIADTETENTRPLVSALNNALSLIQQAKNCCSSGYCCYSGASTVTDFIGTRPSLDAIKNCDLLVMLSSDFPYGFKCWTSKYGELYLTVIAIHIHYLAGV
jgi:thiamine pyrophosphate-dependent acetolactate synthase large subunit-like protein